MKINKIDSSGLNYFILEVNFDLEALIIEPLKKWALKTREQLRDRYLRWKYSSLTGVSGRGRYIAVGGVWVPEYAYSGHKSSHVWNTFFSYSLGRWVDSSKILRDHEKEGKVMMSFQEAERESAKAKSRAKAELRNKIKSGVRESLSEVSRGKRSYYREHMARIPQDMRERAQREQASQLLRGKG